MISYFGFNLIGNPLIDSNWKFYSIECEYDEAIFKGPVL